MYREEERQHPEEAKDGTSRAGTKEIGTNMELRQLRYFLALAQKHNFSRAAEEIGIAQPALSQQIRALEEELGIVLFERTSRRVELTNAGKAFLKHTRRILAEVDRTLADMQAFTGLRRGRVTIGILQSLSNRWLPESLARFHQKYRGLEIFLYEDVSEQLLDYLRSGQLDLAFLHEVEPILPLPPDLSASHIQTEEVFSEEIVLVVSPRHPLAKQALIKPEDLRNEPMLFFSTGAALRQVLLSLSTQGEFTPTVRFESGDIGTIRSLVSEGLGVSVLPRSYAEAPGPPISIVPIDPPLPSRTVFMAWHRRVQHSPAASAYLDFVREDIREHPWKPYTPDEHQQNPSTSEA